MSDFKLLAGELVCVTNSISLWTADLSEACDAMIQGEVGMVLDVEDDYGWIVVMSPRGIVRLIHCSNLKRLNDMEVV